MAGLGESCSHIAATLFAVEAAVKIAKETSCTSLPCAWSNTSGAKIDYAEGCNIDFTSPQRKKVKLLRTVSPATSTSRDIPLPTSDDKQSLYDSIHATGVKSAVLSLVPKYSKTFIPKAVALGLPASLPELYRETFEQLTRQELHDKCEEVFTTLQVSQEQVTELEIKYF